MSIITKTINRILDNKEWEPEEIEIRVYGKTFHHNIYFSDDAENKDKIILRDLEFLNDLPRIFEAVYLAGKFHEDVNVTLTKEYCSAESCEQYAREEELAKLAIEEQAKLNRDEKRKAKYTEMLEKLEKY